MKKTFCLRSCFLHYTIYGLVLAMKKSQSLSLFLTSQRYVKIINYQIFY